MLWELQQSPQQLHLLWLTATLGNTLGGLSSWLIGWWLAKRFPGRGLKKESQHRALERIRRYGSPALLLSWLPVVGDPLCLAAGWSGVRLKLAAIYIGTGKGLRYALLIWLSGAVA
ncbi:MAG: VTT domain-containing protein [Chromatiales bacterium]|nr:VTT domain-containing protein [Chromatiales bacterium]